MYLCVLSCTPGRFFTQLVFVDLDIGKFSDVAVKFYDDVLVVVPDSFPLELKVQLMHHNAKYSDRGFVFFGVRLVSKTISLIVRVLSLAVVYSVYMAWGSAV
jgi:hypothetical protein